MRSCLFPLLLLAACTPQDPPDSTPPPVTCNAVGWQYLVGRHARAASVIPAPKRIVKPGDTITMDFLPERTHIELDAIGRIATIRCG